MFSPIHLRSAAFAVRSLRVLTTSQKTLLLLKKQNKGYQMRKLNAVLVIAGISSFIATSALGQAPERKRPDFASDGPPPFVAEIPERFAVLAAADANKDKKLDVEELATLAEAIADGTLTKPKWLPIPPKDIEIPASIIAIKLASFYEAWAPYDANDNGTLENPERLAIREAILSGDLEPPFKLIRGNNGGPFQGTGERRGPRRGR